MPLVSTLVYRGEAPWLCLILNAEMTIWSPRHCSTGQGLVVMPYVYVHTVIHNVTGHVKLKSHIFDVRKMTRTVLNNVVYTAQSLHPHPHHVYNLRIFPTIIAYYP